MSVQIPITKPYITEDDAQAAAAAVRSGWLAQGPCVAAFEEAIATYVGARHAVATSNCTSALQIALLCCDIGPGDEVIVPSFSFIATANAVLHVGATPIFAEIDPRTYTIDPQAVERAITPRTRAIMPVDQIGLAADLTAIARIAERHGLRVIEDAAPALGATCWGRRVGGISDVTCFSFHPRKSITCGEGGLITTDDAALAARARVLRSHGASISDLERHNAARVAIEEYTELGYNFRMTDMQAAVGLAQFKKLDLILAYRRARAERYNEMLAALPGLAMPYAPSWAPHTYQSYAVRLDPRVWPARDEVMARLLDQGIATRRGVMAIHLEPFYRQRCGELHLPVTEAAMRETLLLPLYATMTENEQDRVIAALQALAPIRVPVRGARGSVVSRLAG